ncbi:uncharacterized protein LOC122804061 [Protopterus annectens]|uniref:uncharacterized protein LOC122804061 n=1 Tax=Protopterus annectens TaxID=7888 RepID=UPI001CFC056E|nr:uncharacterized protein LOC122804061 [Protopterus annectens]
MENYEDDFNKQIRNSRPENSDELQNVVEETVTTIQKQESVEIIVMLDSQGEQGAQAETPAILQEQLIYWPEWRQQDKENDKGILAIVKNIQKRDENFEKEIYGIQNESALMEKVIEFYEGEYWMLKRIWSESEENLKETIKNHENEISKLTEEITRLKEENEKLTSIIKDLVKINVDFKEVNGLGLISHKSKNREVQRAVEKTNKLLNMLLEKAALAIDFEQAEKEITGEGCWSWTKCLFCREM